MSQLLFGHRYHHDNAKPNSSALRTTLYASNYKRRIQTKTTVRIALPPTTCTSGEFSAKFREKEREREIKQDNIAHPRLVVGPDGRCLPPPVVTARVAVVELEPVVLVPPGEEEGDAERPQSPELCVSLYKEDTMPAREEGGVDNLAISLLCVCSSLDANNSAEEGGSLFL